MDNAWQKNIAREDGSCDMGTYVSCMLDALRNSLILLTVFPEQQAKLHPTKIMTDTMAYRGVALLRLLGGDFSPCPADMAATASDPHARIRITASSMAWPKHQPISGV